MNNEKILEIAQRNKNRGKEYENKTAHMSSLWGSIAAVLVGLILFLIEYFISGSTNLGLIAVGLTALGVQYLYEGIKIKKLYQIVFGVIQMFIAICAILVFVEKVVVA